MTENTASTIRISKETSRERALHLIGEGRTSDLVSAEEVELADLCAALLDFYDAHQPDLSVQGEVPAPTPPNENHEREWRRQQALGYAIQHAANGNNSESITHIAERFAAFIEGVPFGKDGSAGVDLSGVTAAA